MKKSSMLILLLSVTFIVYSQQAPAVRTKPVKQTEQTQQTETPSGKFVGMMFNDFSYILQEPKALNPSSGTAGRNSFLFRRATIGYEYTFNKNINAKIEYDAASNLLEQGFVDIKNIAPLMDIKLGLSQTLSSEIIEQIWVYRSLDASILDRKGYTDEFDMGLTITGRMNSKGQLYARLAVYNGNGLLPENDKIKKIGFAVGNWFDKFSVLELYVDYENLIGGKSVINGKIFYGMTSSKMGMGIEAFYRLERKMNITTGADVNPLGGSLYSWFEMMKSLRGVARVDFVDNDFADDKVGHREIYLNIGVDYLPVPDVHLIPNLIYVKNLKKGTTPEIVDRMEVRLTTAVTIK